MERLLMWRRGRGIKDGGREKAESLEEENREAEDEAL